MVRKLLVFITLFLVQITTAQQEEKKVFFSEALAMHLPKYEKKAKDAYFYRDFEKGRELFDTLVQHKLNGSYMDDFKFRKLNGKLIALSDFEKPVYFITYASWCVTTKGEIPALNELAAKYNDKVDFIVLFWDERKNARKAAKEYNKSITVVYVDELDNKSPYVIRNLKHSLGLPTTFLIDQNKKVLDIRRGVYHSYDKSFEESLDANYNSIHDGIANHLLNAGDYENPPGHVVSN